MEATFSSEMLVDFQRSARHYSAEDRTLHNYRLENLKSYRAMSLGKSNLFQHTISITYMSVFSMFIRWLVLPRAACFRFVIILIVLISLCVLFLLRLEQYIQCCNMCIWYAAQFTRIPHQLQYIARTWPISELTITPWWASLLDVSSKARFPSI
jgi:hypothetical protein